MEVARLLPQLMFFHWQQSVVVNQPLGAVLKEARSLAITVGSSTNERVRKEILLFTPGGLLMWSSLTNEMMLFMQMYV